MTDSVLDVLKIALLALLYLFFARVLWAVWSEVRGPRPGRRATATTASGNGTIAAGAAAAGATGSARAAAGGVATGAAATAGLARPGTATLGGAADTPTIGTGTGTTPSAPRGRAATRLTVRQPRERKGASFPIEREITIGRSTTATISIPDDTFVSHLHARLVRTDTDTWLEDLDSTNGTFLNGARLLGAHPLVRGDQVQIGSTVMEAR